MASALLSTHSRAGTITFTVGLMALANFALQADASAFRGHAGDLASDASHGAKPELDRLLLSELEEVLGSEHRRATEARLSRIQTAMKSMFRALPKNSHGRVEHSAVRYAMHRYFVQRHGWVVKGLESRGEAWNTSSPIILKEGMPSHVQGIFETRLGGHGFDLHDVAVMAATLENQVHKEAMERLEQIYQGLERSPQDPVSIEESHEVIDSYMSVYILGANASIFSSDMLRQSLLGMKKFYPNWPETQSFVREVQTNVLPKRDELTYENVASVVEEIGERYGTWQHQECRTLKNDLVALEDRGTGRVRVSEFYRAAVIDGNWQFSESLDFLRQIGALDESEPSSPSVIIPNYIHSPTNCIAGSAYYSVCCIDECEDIFGHIEDRVGSPEALPGEVFAVVAALPSATGDGNRTLSPMLTRRLEEVAAYHGGSIPLHGRLFSQWLHLTFPHQCSYPQVAGTTDPEARDSLGKAATASKEEMLQYVESRPGGGASSIDEEEGNRMWTLEEELLVVRPPAPAPVRQMSSLASCIRSVVFIIALFSFMHVLQQKFATAMSKFMPLLPKHQSKYTV